MKQYFFLLTAFFCFLPLLSQAVEEQGEKQLKVEETILALGADEEANRDLASQAIMENIEPYKQALVEAAASTDPEIQKRAKVLLFMGEQGVSVKSSPAILALAKSALKAGEAEREKRLEELSVAVLKERYAQLCKQKTNELPWMDDPAEAQKIAAALQKTLFLVVLPEKTSPEYQRLVPILKGEKLFQLMGDACVYVLISFNEQGKLLPCHQQWLQDLSPSLGLDTPGFGFWSGNEKDATSFFYDTVRYLKDEDSILKLLKGFHGLLKKLNPGVWKGRQRN